MALWLHMPSPYLGRQPRRVAKPISRRQPIHVRHARPSRLASLLLFSATCALALAGPVFVDQDHCGTDLGGLPAGHLGEIRDPRYAERIDEFEKYAEETRKIMKVPGFSIAVVKDDKVIYAKGFGIKNNRSESVTVNTLFPIASMTKSFTAALAAQLVGEGKLEWEVPIRQYYPEFELQDPIASLHTTLIDLMSHRTGMPRHDTSAMGQVNLTRHEFIRRMRYLAPSKDFRSTWQYNNLMFMVSGEVSTRVSGAALWEDLVTERLLAPLGMKRSGARLPQMAEDADHTAAFIPTDWSLKEFKESPVDTIEIDSAAGSIYSSALEMTRWLRMHLNRGEHENKIIVPAKALEQVLTPHMVIPMKPKFRELGYMSYGLGWDIVTWKGRQMVEHGGNLMGTTSEMLFLPDDSLAVVVLSNRFVTPLPKTIAYMAADYFLDNVAEKSDWRGRFENGDKELSEQILEGIAKLEADRVKGTQPSQPLDAYMGTYVHPAYGEIVISGGAEGGLTAKWHGYEEKLDHYHYDQFLFPKFDFLMSFLTNLTGKVDRLEQTIAEGEVMYLRS